MNYKPSDTMNLVHEVKKLGWHFTHWKENISINRRNVTLSLYREVDPEAWREEYRKKQAAGVMFERRWMDGTWHFGVYDFNGPQKDYREVPQDVSASECQKKALEHLAKTYSADKGTAQLNPTIPPHAAERALWKAQREAGTNEVWQARNIYDHGPSNWADLSVYTEPQWASKAEYRVKPMKLTARIVRNIPMTFREYEARLHEWEFFGTREAYIAECERFGYFVTGKIKEVEQVKSKTVKYYFALYKVGDAVSVRFGSDKENLIEFAKNSGHTIIGDIEEREV